MLDSLQGSYSTATEHKPYFPLDGILIRLPHLCFKTYVNKGDIKRFLWRWRRTNTTLTWFRIKTTHFLNFVERKVFLGGIRGVRHEDRDDDGNDGDDDFRIRRLVVTYGIIMLA